MLAFLSSVLALAGAAAAAASTPAGWSPSSNTTLGETFDGIEVTPGVTLSADSEFQEQPLPYLRSKNSHPSADVTTQPDVYALHTCNMSDTRTYMLLMLDLNIPASDVTTANLYSTLVPGLAANTTTRLHWWGGNYTLDSTTSSYVNSSDAIAPYTAPRPRDELYHSYVLYLFEQPEGYVAGEAALNGTYYDGTANARFNFSLTPIIEAVGEPLAANYFVANDGS